MSKIIEKLEAEREAAREIAASHPKKAELEAARSRCVAIKTEIRNAEAKGDAKRVALAEAEYRKSEAVKLALSSEIFAPVVEAQEKLTAARRALRDEKKAELSASLEGLSVSELESRRHALTAQRKALKAELAAVARALSVATAREGFEEQVAKMSPEEKAALKKALGG